MKCEHITIDRTGYGQKRCERDATHVASIENADPPQMHVCRFHAPWKLAKHSPAICKIEKVTQ